MERLAARRVPRLVAVLLVEVLFGVAGNKIFQGKLGLRVSVSTLIEGPMSEVIEGAGAFPVSASR